MTKIEVVSHAMDRRIHRGTQPGERAFAEMSSFIESFSWDHGRIIVQLKGDPKKWSYPARGSFEYAAFCRVKSKGKFYNRWFKGREGGIRLT